MYDLYSVEILLFLLSCIVSSIRSDVTEPVILDNLDGSPSPFPIKGLKGYIYSHHPNGPIYKPNKRYFVTIEAPEGYKISIEAVHLYLGYPKDSQTCHADSLFLFNNEPDTKMVDAEISSTLGKMILECCTVTKNHTVLAVSEKNSITLYWHTVSLENRLPDTRGFVLKWSTFRTLPLHGSCSADLEFACNNQQTCIRRELACDSTADCQDESDLNINYQKLFGCENIREEVSTASFSGSAIIGIIIGVLLAVSFIIAILVCCCKPSGRKQSNLLNSRNPTLDYQPAPSGLCLGSNCKNSRDINECEQKLNQTNLTLSRNTGVGGDQNYFHKHSGGIV